MPPSSLQLNENSLVSVSKRFIKDRTAKELLLNKFDWNTPALKFDGRTISRTMVGNHEMYDVILDAIPGITLTLKSGCPKYRGPVETTPASTSTLEPQETTILTEDLLEDAVQEDEDEEDEDEEDEIDLTPTEGWTAGEVYIDARLNGSSERGFASNAAKLNMPNFRNASPLDYFLFFLPVHHLNTIVSNTNMHARDVLGSAWTYLTLDEYLKWIALLSVMAVVRHDDRKAYWKLGSSHFLLGFDFSEYMSYNRFKTIMKMHVFEVPNKEKQENDPLYQISSTIKAFNSHMPACLEPAKYLVIDESMNQWLGVGMPNLK